MPVICPCMYFKWPLKTELHTRETRERNALNTLYRQNRARACRMEHIWHVFTSSQLLNQAHFVLTSIYNDNIHKIISFCSFLLSYNHFARAKDALHPMERDRQRQTQREREWGLNSACFIVLVKMYNDDTIKLIVSKTWTKHALFWCLFTMTAQQLVISEASTNPFPTFANKHRLLSSFSHKMNNVHSKNDRHRWQPKSDNHPGMLFSLQLFSTSRRLHSITTWSWTGLSEVSKLCKLSFV